MHISRIIIALILCVSFNCFAETPETERLAKISQDYSKCLNVALGNFASEDLDQKAVAKFYEAIIANTEKMLDFEIKAKHKGTLAFLDVLKDKKILLGYMVAKISEPEKAFINAKLSLKKQNGYDWRKTNKELWQSNGCNAIYNSLR